MRSSMSGVQARISSAAHGPIFWRGMNTARTIVAPRETRNHSVRKRRPALPKGATPDSERTEYVLDLWREKGLEYTLAEIRESDKVPPIVRQPKMERMWR